MLVIRDTDAIAALTDADLRALIQPRADDLLRDFSDMALAELVLFIVVESGDSLEAIDAQLGFPILANLFTDAKFGDPGFTPSWELIEEHPDYFEIVYVISDDGFGMEVFIPKSDGVPPQLIQFCQAYCPARSPS